MAQSAHNTVGGQSCDADFTISSLDELMDFDFAKFGIKGVIFDYGGTIDSRGEHWSDVIYRGYKAAGLDIPHNLFWDAYVYAERELARNPHILPTDNFHDLLRKKINLELTHLSDMQLKSALCAVGCIHEINRGKLAESIAGFCYSEAANSVAGAKPVLESLFSKYPLVMVSNFYGNLNAVLEDFGIRHFFEAVIESAVVGVRKPDPEIFRLGVKALDLPPCKIVTVGDSLEKDIFPSRHLHLRTIQLASPK